MMNQTFDNIVFISLLVFVFLFIVLGVIYVNILLFIIGVVLAGVMIIRSRVEFHEFE